MPVSQHKTTLSNGRLPTYMRHHVHHLVDLLLGRRSRRASNIGRLSLLSPQYIQRFMPMSLHSWRSDRLSYSYDKFVRLKILFQGPSLQNPVEEIPSAKFYQVTGFWPRQFEEWIVENLKLIPERMCVQGLDAHHLNKSLFFLLLQLWKKTDMWDDVSQIMHRQRVWCIKIYHAMFSLLASH